MKFMKLCLLTLTVLGSNLSFSAEKDVPVQVEPAAPSAGETVPFVYLNCFSTSLKLDEKSLMHSSDGNEFTIGFFADEQLLISSGESCSFTVTDVKGQITPNTISYGADIPFLSTVAPGDFVSAIAANEDNSGWFRLQYDYTFGDFIAVFFLEEKKFGFSPIVWIR